MTSSEMEPIYAKVGDLPVKAKRGPKPGQGKGGYWAQKRNKDKADEAAALAAPAPGKCRGCEVAIPAMTVDLITEHVRSSRDRITEAASPKGAETDLLFLAARLDGYCSLGCWRSSRA